MTTWFTADTHFGHAKIVELSHRPFASVDAMDEGLIANWNARVGPKDDVWHLGDFAFRNTLPAAAYLAQLNGRIHMVWGNHDGGNKGAEQVAGLFASAQDVKYLRLDGEKITLYHYAQRVWRNSHKGAWHLFGHTHNCLPPVGRSMDVGVDAQGYAPVSFEEVRAFMQSRPDTPHHPVDHPEGLL